MTKTAIISIDQGTTSSRAMAFTPDGRVLTSSQSEFPQIYPHDGWVEHDPEAIWDTVRSTLRDVYKAVKADGYAIAGIGITNQRETTLVWDRESGKCIYNAIVWQDRRTAETCRNLKTEYGEQVIAEKTGLLFDPYFSASKVAWILDHDKTARDRAEHGALAFGTVDCFLIWRLTGGKVHATDATNASRTSLFNIRTQDWDKELLDIFDVPPAILPDVRDSASDYGCLDPEILGEELPILGVAGDQQAAAIGQGCFNPGQVKSTYGTGCFVILNTGTDCLSSKNRLLSTVCYRLNGQTTYALEGSIFIAGAAVQWLRDELKIIEAALETAALAKQAESRKPIYLVPAFTGLGAPYWDPDARGAIFGLTRDTNRADLVRATLESVCYQTHDLLQAMAADGVPPKRLRVDGGMVQNDWFAQRLSDIVDLPIDRPTVMETTALGAAYLAGLQAGLYDSLEDISSNWQRDAFFTPDFDTDVRREGLAAWKMAVSKVLS